MRHKECVRDPRHKYVTRASRRVISASPFEECNLLLSARPPPGRIGLVKIARSSLSPKFLVAITRGRYSSCCRSTSAHDADPHMTSGIASCSRRERVNVT